jgi:hypothetical protein
MSGKPSDNCKIIIVNCANVWLVHTQVASQLKGARMELKEIKARSMLLVVCTSSCCLDLIWRLLPLR